MDKIIEVAAAVIRDAGNRILVTRRLPGRHLAGMWEFPGGKIESDESPEQALARELDEELGIRMGPVRPLATVCHSYPEKRVRLRLFEVHSHQGSPTGREGQPLRWVDPEAMREYKLG